MIGCLMFLGCPFRMILRLAGGDLNAIFGLVGFGGGILVGVFFLSKGYSLKRTYKLPALEGRLFIAIEAVLLVLLISSTGFYPFYRTGWRPGGKTCRFDHNNLLLTAVTPGVYFNLGLSGQPVAHTDGLWNALGMFLTGVGCVLLGGCPLRQLVLAGEGNTD